MFVLFQRRVPCPSSLIIDQFPYSILRAKFLRDSFLNIYITICKIILTFVLTVGLYTRRSTTNQLTFLYNAFCQALDSGKELRAVFCDISKAFNRVWHSGLLHKLHAAGVTGEALAWFKNYLSDRKQRVVLPSTSSDWALIRAGVP